MILPPMASCPPIYAWADNIQHMDPCEVASSLMNACGLPPLQPITSSENTYPGPTTNLQSPCVCFSFVYALVSACSDCQGGQIESWPTWSTNCYPPSVDLFEDPLLANISVPAWAYFDVNSDPIYSRAAASSSAAALQATPSFASATAVPQIVPTSTSIFQTTPTDASKSSLASSATASFGPDLPSTTTGNRTAAIAGGAVAAVVLLAMVALLAYWYIRRRQRKRVPPSAAYMALYGSETAGLGLKGQLTSNNGTDSLFYSSNGNPLHSNQQ